MDVSVVTPLSSVTIVVFTDGEDNYSHKTSKDVKEVLDKSISSGMKISYVGSNQDAIFTGSEMGIPRESCLAYVDENLDRAMRSVSEVVNRCITGEATSIKFDDEVRRTLSDTITGKNNVLIYFKTLPKNYLSLLPLDDNSAHLKSAELFDFDLPEPPCEPPSVVPR